MADDHPAASGSGQHGRRDFARIGAFLQPENVLRADGDVGAARGFDGQGDSDKRRADDDFSMTRSRDQGSKVVQESCRFGRGLVHFPVPGEYRFGHASRIAAGGLRQAQAVEGIDESEIRPNVVYVFAALLDAGFLDVA
jgi:hypothetical protein